MTEQTFLRDIATTLRCDTRRADGLALVVMDELRRRLTPGEAADLAAQLPARLQHDWRTAETVERRVAKIHAPELIGHVRLRAALPDDAEAERAVLAVFGALQRLLGSPTGQEGEAWDVFSQLPKDLKKLWVRAGAHAMR